MSAERGLDLCRAYYGEIIRPLLAEAYPGMGDDYAAALIGWGSDVLGHDDALSRDHEWGPRCLLFLPPAWDAARAAVYEALDRRIPATFRGHATRFAPSAADPDVRVPDARGRAHIEVTTVERYARRSLGALYPADDAAWLLIPEQKLLEITRGEVFHDGRGDLTALRRYYAGYYPLDVWKYRLAFAWQAVGWDADLIGLCARRGDTLSVRHAVGSTLGAIRRLVFQLNRRYATSYVKWFHREFYRLPCLAGEIGPRLERCYRDPDPRAVERECEALCRELARFQDGLGLLPALALRRYPFSRSEFALDTNDLAAQIAATIAGPLRGLPLYGAADQWVGHPDLLLAPERLKALEALYRPEPPESGPNRPENAGKEQR